MKRLILFLALSQCRPCPAGVVADTLFAECRGESKSGQMAVASVIYNRAKNSGKTFKAVCLAPKQFSCHNKGYAKAKPANERERQLLAFFEGIEKQMKNGTFQPTGPWTHYHTTSVNPYWSKSMTERTVIDRHVFGVTK